MTWREGKTGHRDKRVVPCSGGVREPGMCGHSSRGNREASERNLRGIETAATEATGKDSIHTPVVVFPRGVGRQQSTWEVGEQWGGSPSGIDGGKGAGQEEPVTRSREPDTKPDCRVDWIVPGASERLLWRQLLEVGAVCGSSARTDLCAFYYPQMFLNIRAPSIMLANFFNPCQI